MPIDKHNEDPIQRRELIETTEDDEIFNFLIDSLHEGEVQCTFEKADGSDRQMHCTLVESYYEHLFEGKEKPVKDETMVYGDTVTVYDIMADGWRKITRGKIKSVQQI